ncbi:DUF4181 domain-containing protein [Neobacillus piezotolerans]|nr:DUF4181 domain-containing protein [Neobacillus piezotolerans]
MGISIQILGLLLVLSEILLRRLIVGKGGQEIYDTVGKKFHLWGRTILILIGLFFLFFVLDLTYELAFKRFILILLAVIYAFEAFIGWMYIKSSKAFLVPILLLLIATIYCYNFVF